MVYLTVTKAAGHTIRPESEQTFANKFLGSVPDWWVPESEDTCSLHTSAQARVHVCSVARSCLTLCDSMDHRLPGSSVHGSSQQEYWNRFHFLLQGIFPTQGLNLCLLKYQGDPSTTKSSGKHIGGLCQVSTSENHPNLHSNQEWMRISETELQALCNSADS